ncbi:DinB family protein [Paenibacillus oenotherae]|uniref:DinB family protein n=1 Tax=Paenibacillus oenotherae TaxID=1435645 RepID=A0ABS7D5X6_9BACL|nr:DinB family protein [Paenibacillus oenotherae]MBW7475352.1 DinB family protein [Paenibacillus oenotherae]
MSQSPVDIALYLQTHGQLSQAVEGLPEETLKWKAAPNQWSVTEVLAHLADHNIVVSFRIREILSRSEARLPAFSQDPWVDGQRANEGNAADILNAFGALLHYNSLLFQRLTPEDWEKTGVNWKGDTVSLAAIIHAFIAHVQVHLAQIARIKQGESGLHHSSCTL